MPKLKTNEEFLIELKEKMPHIEALENYVNTHTKIKCKCKLHNEICYTTPKRLLKGYEVCPKCVYNKRSSSRTKTYEDFLKELKDKNITDVIPIKGYKNKRTKMLFKCSCGDLWETTPERVLLGNHCKKCGYKSMSGENSYWFNPNLTEEDRMDRNHRFRNPEYVKFVKDCFERDNYTCQITDKKSKGDIVVHHINGFNWDIDNRTNINNGITLSNEIHKEFHKMYGKGNNTKEQFIEFVQYLYDNNRITLEKLEFLTNRLNNIK